MRGGGQGGGGGGLPRGGACALRPAPGGAWGCAVPGPRGPLGAAPAPAPPPPPLLAGLCPPRQPAGPGSAAGCGAGERCAVCGPVTAVCDTNRGADRGLRAETRPLGAGSPRRDRTPHGSAVPWLVTPLPGLRRPLPSPTSSGSGDRPWHPRDGRSGTSWVSPVTAMFVSTWRHGAKLLNRGVTTAHACRRRLLASPCPAEGAWVPPVGVYLPMIQTHSGPPRCRPGGDTATSLLPCVGPRSLGSALPSPAQARLSALCSTAAPLRCFVDDFATRSSLRSLRLESLGECLSLSSHHDDSHARSKYSAICR